MEPINLKRIKREFEYLNEILTIQSEKIESDISNNLMPSDGKPYPNEHACRLKPPGNYKRFARQNCKVKHSGKCIDFIYGIKAAAKSELQAMRYNKKIWNASNAKALAKIMVDHLRQQDK